MSSDQPSDPSLRDAIARLNEGLAAISTARDRGVGTSVESASASQQSRYLHQTSHEDIHTGAYLNPHHSFSDTSTKHSEPTFPQNISVKEAATTPTFGLFLVPDDDQLFNEYCFALKGQGSTFCVQRKCQIASHKKYDKQELEKGDLFILKSQDAAWTKWGFNSSQMDSSLLNKWLSEEHSVEQWSHLFGLATRESMDQEETKPRKITFGDIENQEHYHVESLTFKTPAKKYKREIKEKYDKVIIPKLEKLLGIPHEDNFDASPKNLSLCFQEVSSSISELSQGLMKLRSLQVSEATNSYDLYDSLETKVNLLSDAIGAKPQTLSQDFNAPDLWLALASIANSVQHLKASDTSRDSSPIKLLQTRTNALEQSFLALQ